MPRILPCRAENMGEISACVGGGGVIVFPTDTVYGIGCDPYEAAAVDRIYTIKGRDRRKPLPVLASSISRLETIAEIDPRAERIASRFWPGPVTVILRLKDARLGRSLGISDRIAVRVPGGDCVAMILERCGLLVGTSANVSGDRPITCLEDCAGRVCGHDIFVDGGAAGGTAESTIVDASSEEIRIIREGAISGREILADWI